MKVCPEPPPKASFLLRSFPFYTLWSRILTPSLTLVFHFEILVRNTFTWLKIQTVQKSPVPAIPATQSSFPEGAASTYLSRDSLPSCHHIRGDAAVPSYCNAAEVYHIYPCLFCLICFEDHPLSVYTDMPPHFYFLSYFVQFYFF